MERDTSFSDERKYTNDEITVYWKPSACVHASYCYRELIEVFDPSRRPWVDMNGASTDRIIEVVNMCPTEALTWKWNDEARNGNVGADQSNHVKFRRPELAAEDTAEASETPVSVKIMVDGPVVLTGSFTLIFGGKSREIENGIVSLCRCGASDQQPFCDGQHRRIGFTG